MESWYEPPANNAEANAIIPEDIPESISDWLANLRLLYGIPLSYLVPDESMLPPESIAFFCIDEAWVDVLTDGALSIGRNTTKDALNDAASGPAFRTSSYMSLTKPRLLKAHKKWKRFLQTDTPSFNGDGIRAGFFLRSEIVSHWHGIEVTGYSNDNAIKLSRMESLSDEIMVCVFEGNPDTVVFAEPTEALHFGARDNKREIFVRSIEEGKIGKPIGTCAIPYDRANGRVKIAELAETLKKTLGATEFNSAHLALEMLSVADICSFKKGREE